MKHLKHLLTALLLLVATVATAHDFEVDGIYYNILSEEDRTVAVTDHDDLICDIGNVVIPENVTYNDATYSVTRIGDGAFQNCWGLTSITIPNSVTSIGNKAFFGCSGLTSITSCIPADKLFVPGYDAFGGVDKDICTLYVPYGAKETYAATEGWSDFVNIVELEETTEVTVIKGENGEAGGVYYDLQGRRVENPANGIYIVNGKKVLVK